MQKICPALKLTFRNGFFCLSSSEIWRQPGQIRQVRRVEVTHASHQFSVSAEAPASASAPTGSSSRPGVAAFLSAPWGLLESGSTGMFAKLNPWPYSQSSKSDSLKRTLESEFYMLLLLSHFSRVRLCATPETAAHQAPPSLGFSRQEYWSGLPFPSPMHESEKWKWSRSVVSDSEWPHRLQPTRLFRPWDFPGKCTGVGYHCLLRICCLCWS